MEVAALTSKYREPGRLWALAVLGTGPAAKLDSVDLTSDDSAGVFTHFQVGLGTDAGDPGLRFAMDLIRAGYEHNLNCSLKTS